MVNWTDSGQFNNKSNEPRLSDLVEMLELKKKAKSVRLIGPARRIAIHWIEINKKAGGTARIPRICLAYDGDKGEFNGTCPYCDTLGNRPRVQVVTNVIDREVQENRPRKAAAPKGKETKPVEHFGDTVYLKTDKDSPSWTPIRLASFTPSVANKIVDLAETNRRTVKGEKRKYGPDHKKFGFDLVIKYDPDREPANQYTVLKGDNSALTEEELEYLRWRLDIEQPKPLAEAKLDAKSLLKVLKDKPDAEEDADETPKKGKKKTTTRDDFDDDDFDDDEDEKPKKAKKGKKSRRDDDEDEDEEEDERPSKSKKSKRRPVDDDDDDEEEEKTSRSKSKRRDDDDDDDDDEDEPPKKKSRSSSQSDEDDDEDEDEAPRKASKKNKKASKSKRRDDDDDEDDDDWGDDD